ncbi:MAG: hypothetical protein WKG07_32000 [Hymenobacter sp.]
MLGSNDSEVSWPACGEIDIMELRGNAPKVNNSTMHFGTSVATHQYKGTSYTPAGRRLCQRLPPVHHDSQPERDEFFRGWREVLHLHHGRCLALPLQ